MNTQTDTQRIQHLERLVDSATGAISGFAHALSCKPDGESVLQAINDLKTRNRDLVSERNAAIAAERTWETTMMRVCGEDGPASVADKFKVLVAENDINLHGAARELNTSWMMHKTMLGAQAALHCLIQGDIRGARDWLEGTTDEAFAEIPDNMTPADLQNWFDKNMTSSDGNNGFLTYEEALNKLRQRTPATSSVIAAIRAEGVDLAIERLHKKFEGAGFIGVPVMALESLAAQLREGAQK